MKQLKISFLNLRALEEVPGGPLDSPCEEPAYQSSSLVRVGREPSTLPQKGTEKLSKELVLTANLQTAADLKSIWCALIQKFFSDRTDLLDYKIAWSTRPQKRTLASCNLRARKVLVAQELNHADYFRFLPALVYHELCHAVLGLSVKSETGKSRWHGAEFRNLERQHSEIELLNRWIREGGWRQAVRRHRARHAHPKRKRTPRSKIKTSRFSSSRLLRSLMKTLGI